MPLEKLSIDPWEGALPSRIADLISAGTDCLESFHVRHFRNPVPGFYPSDFELVYRILRQLACPESDAATNRAPRTICEWGCGIPIVSALAAELGLKTKAIECDERLVAAGRDWVADQSLDIEIRHASLIPADLRSTIAKEGPFQGLVVDPAGVESASRAWLRSDLVFCYPWPGEADTTEFLFEHIATSGDLLVTFRGSCEIHVHRRRSRRVDGGMRCD